MAFQKHKEEKGSSLALLVMTGVEFKRLRHC